MQHVLPRMDRESDGLSSRARMQVAQVQLGMSELQCNALIGRESAQRRAVEAGFLAAVQSAQGVSQAAGTLVDAQFLHTKGPRLARGRSECAYRASSA